MDTGLSWHVFYDGIKDADACFQSLEYEQGFNVYDRAVHKFAVLNMEHAEKVSKALMEKDELQFKIHAAPGLESKPYYHHPIRCSVNENRGVGKPTIDLHTIGHAHWTLLKDAQFKGYKTGGKVESAIQSVCQEAGVSVEVKAKGTQSEDFNIMYQPGCSHWDFIAKYLLQRFPKAVVLTTKNGKEMILEQANKLESLTLDNAVVVVNEKIESPFSAFTSGGGKFDGHWQHPFKDDDTRLVPVGNEIKGTKVRTIDISRFTEREAASVYIGNQNDWAYQYKTRALLLQGFIAPEGNFAPAYILKCEKAEIDGAVFYVKHIVKGAKYRVMANVWNT